MFFTQVSLVNFKNYNTQVFEFSKRIIGICGLNGKGKTNLLDALYYLCFTRSYFTRADQINIHFGRDGFRLEGIINDQAGKPQKITCIYRDTSKKEFLLNDIPYEKFSHHIGKFPAVFIAPDDISLINGSSVERRKFLDTVICQSNATYLQNLILYNQLLTQRNALLKYDARKKHRDLTLLSAIDERLVGAGNYLHACRKSFCSRLFPIIQELYELISGTAEMVVPAYDSQLNTTDFAQLLKESAEKDRLTLRTNAGIHKDDMLFELMENTFRSIASQGQKKSLLFACKLAEFKLLKSEKETPPILLLDDIFEKLDEERVGNLLRYILSENEGQVFVTDTHEERLKRIISAYSDDLQILFLD